MQRFQQFYFHSVRNNFQILEAILSSGYILSREKAGIISRPPMFNGEKWISICKHYSPCIEQWDYDYCPFYAYQLLVVNGLSIVLDDNIDATKTFYMSFDDLYPGVIKDENPIRYSDCIDEYQVRDSISRKHFLAIAYPYLRRLDMNKRQAPVEYDRIRFLLDKFHYDIPIIDSSNQVIEDELSLLEKKLIR